MVDECEAIMVSGSSSYIEGKLLAVARLTSSTGEAQFEAVREQILLWDIKDNIRYMTYDTTSSNTGVNKGCCLRLEELLNDYVTSMANLGYHDISTKFDLCKMGSELPVFFWLS